MKPTTPTKAHLGAIAYKQTQKVARLENQIEDLLAKLEATATALRQAQEEVLALRVELKNVEPVIDVRDGRHAEE